MKKLGTMLALSAMICSVVFAAGEVLKLSNESDFPNSVKMIEEEGTQIFETIPKTIISNMNFEVDLEKTYLLKGSFRNLSKKEIKVFFGFVPLDSDGKTILPQHVNCVKGTETELANAVKAGDTKITLKDSTGWQKLRKYCFVAFNVKDDLSDLPNRDLSALVDSVNGNEVTLSKAISKAYPAGTQIRAQYSGNTYLYTETHKTNDQWQEFTETIQGDKWRHKTAKAAILVYPYPSKDNRSAKIQFKDISVEVITQKMHSTGTVVERMLTLEGLHEKAVPYLKECVLLLKSSDPIERIAAMKVFISANIRYPKIVPDLLKMINSPSSGRSNEIAFGTAVTTLLTVCEDNDVIVKLLESPNKRVRMAMSCALFDSPRLTPELHQKLNWPLPDIARTNKSIVVNGDFEVALTHPVGWELTLKDSAEGLCSIDSKLFHTGKQSLRIDKTNGKGYVELRSVNAIEVPAKAFWYWRGYYHAEDCTGSSLLFFRLEDEKGNVDAYDDVPRAGWGWQSQAYLLNSPPGEWNRRVLGLRPAKGTRKFHLVVRIYGNPVTVWLDDLSFPAPQWKINSSPRLPEPPRYTEEEARTIIAKRPIATANLEKNNNGKVEIKINGKSIPPVLYFPIYPDSGDFKMMEDAGVKLHNVILRINDFGDQLTGGSVWPTAANDNYNFKPMIDEIRKFIRRSPKSNIILGFNLHWPADYVKNNPDTKWLNKHGEAGYGNVLYMMGFKKESRLRKGETLWPSPYLDKPFEDVAKIMRAFIRELKKEGLDKVIAGAFASGGHDGQFEVLRRDHSKNGTLAWSKWLKSKYGSNDALRKALNNSSIVFDNVTVPANYYEKYNRQNSSSLFSPQTEQPDRDYEEYRQERTWRIKEYLIKSIKDEFNKPMLGITWLMGGALGKSCKPLLESKVIDIIVTQPTYQNRRPGMPNGNTNPFESFHAHNKLWVLEMDLRSWLRETYANEIGSMKIGTPLSPDEFRSVNRKLTGDFLTAGNGWWYFDISSNAFANPEIMQEIKTSIDTFIDVQQKHSEFRPDVAIVTSSNTPHSARMTINRFRNNLSWLLGYQGNAIAASGVPYDSYFFDDLIATTHGDRYKVYVFLNAVELTSAQREFIEKKLKRGGKAIVWLYAPGYLNGKSPNDASVVSAVTGMNVNMELEPKEFEVYPVQSQHPLSEGLLPRQGYGDIFRLTQGADTMKAINVSRFTVNDPQSEVIARYAFDDAPAIAVKKFPNWTSVYVTASSGLSPELLNNIAKQAGAYRLCPPNMVQSSMNGSFLSIHAIKSGNITFSLPYQARVTDVHSKKEIPVKMQKFNIYLKAGESRWFNIKAD